MEKLLMILTVKFRLYPSEFQKNKLVELCTIYNRVKRRGYGLLFKGVKDIQSKLMNFCHNNPYVNTILIENKAKLEIQKTWLKKKEYYIKHKIKVIKEKIETIKRTNRKDKRLRGLYNLLSSLQNKILNLNLKPIMFAGKYLFKDRILGKISKEEFKIRRDASFGCIGKAQYGVKNLNLKILPTKALKIRTFSKVRGKKWVIVPFIVNKKQEKRFQEILQAKKYAVIVKRKFVKGELRYYAHISYEAHKPEIKYSFENGAIGLDFNYNFATLTNIDNQGEILSYNKIIFRNLHSYRRNNRADYISFKLNKIVNYCINKKKGLVIEDLSFDHQFSYNKKLNRMLSNFRISALELLKRKCMKMGVAVREVHPAYTSLIGKYKYSRLHNLSIHILASYVIARRGLGFEEKLPPIYKRLLAQVGDVIKPRLKPSSPYYEWARIHDLFKYSGITSFKTSEIEKKSLLMKNVLNPATGAQPDNLRAGLSQMGVIEDYHKFWNFINSTQFL